MPKGKLKTSYGNYKKRAKISLKKTKHNPMFKAKKKAY